MNKFDQLGQLPVELRTALGAEVGSDEANVVSNGPVFTRNVFVRTTGDDTVGDGTQGKPYSTLARALKDVPLLIHKGQRWIIDITGITESDIVIPPFRGDLSNDFDFVSPVWQSVRGALTIWAQPVVTDTITPADIISQTLNAVTGHLTIATTKVFVPGALKGKMILGGPGSFIGTAIIDNTASDLEVALFFPTAGNVDIVDTGATLTVTDAAFSALSVNNVKVAVVLAGIKCIGNGGFRKGLRIQTAGNVTLNMCNLSGLSTDSEGFTSIQNSIVGGGEDISLASRILTTGGSLFLNAVFDEDGPRGGQFGSVQHLGTAFHGCNPVGNSTGATESLGPGNIVLSSVIVRAATGSGVQFNGGTRGELQFVTIDGSAGDAVTVDGIGLLVVNNVQGAGNGGIGVNIKNSGQVKREAASAVTGAGGDFKIGGNAVKTWATFTGDENDLAAVTPQMCRMRT